MVAASVMIIVSKDATIIGPTVLKAALLPKLSQHLQTDHNYTNLEVLVLNHIGSVVDMKFLRVFCDVFLIKEWCRSEYDNQRNTPAYG